MSATYGLVKFKKTDNIYMCCYEGTSDIMIPFLFKPEECFQNDNYHPVSYGQKLGNENEWNVPDVDDLDDIEIYSDYGKGFYWTGKGSESAKYIISEINFGESVHNYTNGKPEWVNNFWNSL